MQNPIGIFKDPTKPTRTELKVWGYGDYYPPVSDFQLFVMEDPDLIAGFAADPRCARRDFFLESLYVWLGDQVRSGLARSSETMSVVEAAENSDDDRLKTFSERAKRLIEFPEEYDGDKWGIGGSYAKE